MYFEQGNEKFSTVCQLPRTTHAVFNTDCNTRI